MKVSEVTARCSELINLHAIHLKEVCANLARSGGIDLDAPEWQGYGIAKIVLTAALHQTKDDYAPTSAEGRAAVKNLKRF